MAAENRIRAGGSIGSAAVLREAPDGYTPFANCWRTANPSIYAKLQAVRHAQGLRQHRTLWRGPNVLIVGTGPGQQLGDFIAAAKTKPGTLNFSSAGIGSEDSPIWRSLLMAGIDSAHVPYKGTPEAIGDTIAGRVCCYFAPINAALQALHVRGGARLRFAVSSAQRSSLLPDADHRRRVRRPFNYTLWWACGDRRRCPPAW